MTINLDLNLNKINHNFELESDFGFKREYDGFRVSYTKGKRVYLIAMTDGMNMAQFYKNMKFEDNGDVTIGFNKERVKIGEYTKV